MIRTITRWDTGATIWSGEAETIKDAIHAALAAKADCWRADLRDADLGGADLGGANLRCADLRGANLRCADLMGADLRGANLVGANLVGANLVGADLRGANLADANLVFVRDDLWAVLSAAPAEVPALLLALNEGRVDGSCYDGPCACLVGTIANARGCAYGELAPLLRADSRRPAEAFFMAIHEGDTPATNQACKLAIEWVEEWLTRMRLVFGPKEIAA